MQNVMEFMVNYDGLSNNLPDGFFQDLNYYQQYESPVKILLENYLIYFKTIKLKIKMSV
jgi:hypothetical protein